MATVELLVAGGVYMGLILLLFFALGCVDNVANVLTCCLTRETLSQSLRLSTVFGDLGIAIGVLVAGGSVTFDHDAVVKAIVGLCLGAATTLLYVMVVNAQPRRGVVWLAALLRAAPPLYVAIILTGPEYEASSAVLSFAAVTVFAVIAEPFRATSD